MEPTLKDRRWADANLSLMRLNELFPTKPWVFEVTSSLANDLPGNGTFICELQFDEQVFDGRCFTGSGTRKDLAKRDAAERALNTLFHEQKLPSSYMTRMAKILGAPNETIPEHRPQTACDAQGAAIKRLADLELTVADNQPSAKRPKSGAMSTWSAYPLYYFNLKYGGNSVITWGEASQVGLYGGSQFQVTLEVDGKKIVGTGISKKAAKSDAARQALEELDTADESSYSAAGGFADDFSAQGTAPHSHCAAVANRLRQCCIEKFLELRSSLPDALQSFKVLAGVVQLTGGETASEAEATVVSLATGTKCIHGDQLCMDGTSIHDCHAEVLARRGLQAYMLHQIQKSAAGETSIFDFREGTTGSSSSYVLKSVVSFHLVVSSAPCGDSRLFSVSLPTQLGTENSDIPLRAVHGKLRCKIEAGEGTVLCDKHKLLQTMDGLAAGERMRTMCCSDKVACWNAVGVQGALLSNILALPVHFETITIGNYYQYSHVRRSVYGRLSGLVLPQPYRIHEPFIATCGPFPGELIAAKASDFAMNWLLPNNTPEVIFCATGKCVDGSTSRLAKKCQGKLYLETCAKAMPPKKMPTSPFTYEEMKNQCPVYQRCKMMVIAHLGASGFGAWIHKPADMDQFVP